jgi:hypothetical protein
MEKLTTHFENLSLLERAQFLHSIFKYETTDSLHTDLTLDQLEEKWRNYKVYYTGKGKNLDKGQTRFGSCPKYPPRIEYLPTRSVVRRFVSSSTVSCNGFTFPLSSGHRQFSVETVADTTAVSWVDVWRITKISMWCNNDVEHSTTVTLYPIGTDTGDNSYNDREAAFSMSSRSESLPGYMSIVPSPYSPLGSWHKTSTVNSSGLLFSLAVEYGGAGASDRGTITMDIHFDYVENMVGSPQGYSVSTTVTPIVAGSLGGFNLYNSGSACFLLQGVNQFGG